MRKRKIDFKALAFFSCWNKKIYDQNEISRKMRENAVEILEESKKLSFMFKYYLDE